jgi:hypothetical protein
VSEHLTSRVPDGTSERLARRARALGTVPRSLAARYIDEGLRRDDHALIRFADGPGGRRAAVAGAPLDVWEVVVTVRDHDGDLDAAAAYLEIPIGLVDAAITYYGEFPEEIDRLIAANEELSARAEAAWRAGRAAVTE